MKLFRPPRFQWLVGLSFAFLAYLCWLCDLLPAGLPADRLRSNRRLASESAAGVKIFTPATIDQKGSSSGGASLPPLRFCSRVLIFAFAVIELCWKRNDSLPVSTMWQ